MAELVRLPGIEEPLPAMLLGLKPTSCEASWAGPRYTVQLLAPLQGVRVHSRAGAAASSKAHLAFGSAMAGRWFAIGDIVLTREAYIAQHALPGGFTDQHEWLFPATTVLNVGIAGPLFGHSGGALQAEWLSGPAPQPRELRGYWSDRHGNA